MTRKRRLRLAALAVVLFMGVTAYRMSSPWVSLGDEWRIRFLAAGAGGVEYSDSNPAMEWTRNHTPWWINERISKPIVINTAPDERDNSLVMAFLMEPQGSARIDMEESFHVDLVLFDSEGSRSVIRNAEILRPFGASHEDGPPSSMLMWIREPVYPRRCRNLRFQILNTANQRVLFDQTIINPGYLDTVPNWSASSMPIDKTVGPVTLTLKEITQIGDALKLNADWEVTTDDPQWQNPIVEWTYSDATGNQGESLSTTEPAWKVNARVRSRSNAPFRPEDVHRVSAVPVMDPLEIIAFEESHLIQDIEINPLLSTGPGRLQIKNGKLVKSSPLELIANPPRSEMNARVAYDDCFYEIASSLPGILIRHDTLKPGISMKTRIVSVSGQSLQVDSLVSSQQTFNRKTDRWIPYQRPDNSTSCFVDTIIHSDLHFEFIVKPPRRIVAKSH